MFIDDVNTQTRFMVLFTSGSLHTWGKPLDASRCISPWYLSTIYPQLTTSLYFYRHTTMTEYAFFLQGVDMWRKEMALICGSLNICPQLQWFHLPSLTPAELFSLTSLRAWGEKQKVCHDITFLVVKLRRKLQGIGSMVC